jgi:acyl-coenzyme A thioesterase PaaI-like protein
MRRRHALADLGLYAAPSPARGATGFTTISSRQTSSARPKSAIEVEAKLIHGGRLTQVWDAEVRREGDSKALALFRCTQMMLYPK